MGARVEERAELELAVPVGLSICWDHSRVREYDKTVDLYILISCSQDLR